MDQHLREMEKRKRYEDAIEAARPKLPDYSLVSHRASVEMDRQLREMERERVEFERENPTYDSDLNPQGVSGY